MADKQPIITIESPIGGWVSDFRNSTAARQGTENVPGKSYLQYTSSTGVSVSRPTKLGHIVPAEVFNAFLVDDTFLGSHEITSLPRASATAVQSVSSPTLFILGGLSGTAPRVVAMNTSKSLFNAHSITPTNNFTTVGSTGFWGEDIVYYTATYGSSSTYKSTVFYSWNDSGSGDIGRVDANDLSTFNDTFMSSVPTGAAKLFGGVPHRMQEGPDKILYITNGQYIASYDSTTDQSTSDGTFNPKALDLGQGWVATDIRKFQNYIAIACVKTGTTYQTYSYSSESKVVLWDGSSLDFNFVYSCQDNFVSALYVNDKIWAFTAGRNGTTKIKYLPLNATVFQTAYEAPSGDIGLPPQPTSIDFYNGAFTWIPSDSYSDFVCSYMPDVGFHISHVLNNGSASASAGGLLKNIEGSNLYVGVSGFTTPAYRIIGANGAGGYITPVDWRSKLYELPYKASIKRVIIYFSQFTSDSSLILSLFKDYTGGTGAAIQGANDQYATENTITSANYPDVLNTMSVSFNKDIQNVNSFYINLRFNHADPTKTAAIVRKVEIYYEPTGKP